jgi:hypothetical protein
MTGERFDDFSHLEMVSPVSTAPAGGWRVLWQPWRTVVALAAMPGLFVINLLISDFTLDPIAVVLIALVSAAQAVVLATFLPQPNKNLVSTCGAIPPLTMIAASIMLADLPRDLTMGFMALVLACIGAAFRFLATTCRV